MPKPAQTSDIARAAFQKPQDSQGSDVLHFLTRTLQAHFLDAEPRDVLAKLQNLQDALAQQEHTLADWPDSPSKDRICAALAKAKSQVAQIVEDFQSSGPARGAKAS
jgi:hypothetical protein